VSDLDTDYKLETFDEHPSDLVNEGEKEGKRIAVIRTSDRINFKRCRRKWGWSSHLRANLQPRSHAAPLWFGSGFHFALEDFHGPNAYGHPTKAFEAYVIASKRYYPKRKIELPADMIELEALGYEMLSYYADEWLLTRNPMTTFVYNDVPQTEVNFRVKLPWEPGRYDWDEVVYSGTIDRVAIDDDGYLWALEYKTAKVIQVLHYGTDDQISSYCWALKNLYPGYPIGGVIYQQHRKAAPKDPKLLRSGKLSTDKRQMTTSRRLRQTMTDIYGAPDNAPADIKELYYAIQAKETRDMDSFIRRDRVLRNDHQIEAQGVKILMEVEDMLNPDLPLYPNPDRTCAFFCPFMYGCIALDDGSDWKDELNSTMMLRETVYDSWREFLPSPEQILNPPPKTPLYDSGLFQ
jgi:hypothetical protein